MYDNTKIKLKRTKELLKKPANAGGSVKDIQTQGINFGEPIFVDNNSVWGNSSAACNSYLVIGSPVTNGKVNQAAIFKAFWDVNKANRLVFTKENNEGLVDEANNPVSADRLVVDTVSLDESSSTRYYILCQAPNANGKVTKFDMGNSGIYISSTGVLYGAAWNDYAEKRHSKSKVFPGEVVCEVGDGSLVKSSERLQACPYVVSDTYGMVIGDEDTPVAVSGRVLVHMDIKDRSKVSIGDCLCAGDFGKAYIMSREEIKEYPDRILGIVTSIPLEDKWNGVDINNRVWIKIK